MMIADAPQHLALHQLSEYQGRPLWLYFPHEVEKSGWYIYHKKHDNNIFLEFSDGLDLMVFAYQSTWFAYPAEPQKINTKLLHPPISSLSAELPVPLGSVIYTVESTVEEYESNRDYDTLPMIIRIRRAIYRRRVKNREFYIEDHVVDAFVISHTNGSLDAPVPCRNTFDGPAPITGFGGKWYPTKAEAEAAKKILETE